MKWLNEPVVIPGIIVGILGFVGVFAAGYFDLVADGEPITWSALVMLGVTAVGLVFARSQTNSPTTQQDNIDDAVAAAMNDAAEGNFDDG